MMLSLTGIDHELWWPYRVTVITPILRIAVNVIMTTNNGD